MGWLTDVQRGYRMARGVEQYLQERAQAQAEFRRELADLDPAGQEAAQAAVRARTLVKWVAAGGTFSLLSFAAGPEAGVLVSALVGTRVALLIRKPAQERRKRALIEAHVPLLNEYRELLVRYTRWSQSLPGNLRFCGHVSRFESWAPRSMCRFRHVCAT